MSDLSKELRAQANQHPLDADLLMFDVAASQIGTLEQERDELAARVERMRAAMLVVEVWDCKGDSVKESYDQYYADGAWDAIKDCSAASLPLHDAGVLRKWAARFGQEAYPKYETKYGEGHYVALTNVSRMLHEEANQIEQESKS
jgi:hypothetical protein